MPGLVMRQEAQCAAHTDESTSHPPTDPCLPTTRPVTFCNRDIVPIASEAQGAYSLYLGSRLLQKQTDASICAHVQLTVSATHRAECVYGGIGQCLIPHRRGMSYTQTQDPVSAGSEECDVVLFAIKMEGHTLGWHMPPSHLNSFIKHDAVRFGELACFNCGVK